MNTYYVYILASKTGVLYTGVTNDLGRRLGEHSEGLGSAFVTKYNVHRLVYFEEHPSAAEAIAREKQIKRWRREKKERLIAMLNPDWRDIALERTF